MAEEVAKKVWAAYEKQEISGGQLLASFKTIFSKDFSREQAEKILQACSPYQVTGHDTPSDVEAFLSDFEALKGKVSTCLPVPSMEEYFEVTTQAGRLSTCVGSLLSKMAVGGEEFVALRALNFQRIWDLLREFAAGPKQLNYISTKNVAERFTDEWKLFIKSKRPDNIIMGRGKVYGFGEEKEKAEDFEKAKGELTAKVVELPAAMYGKLKFVVCYAAAGHLVQFYVLRLRKLDNSPFLTPVTGILDASVDIPRLVLHYVKLYFLLLGMDASVGAALPFPLHTFTPHSHCQVMLTLDGAVKKIVDFEAYSSQYKVTFSDLKAAYIAAKVAGGYMISSVFGPSVESKEVEIERHIQVLEGERENDFTEAVNSSGVLSEERHRRVGDSTPSGSSSSTSLKRSSPSPARTNATKRRRLETKTVTKEVTKLMKQVYEVETLPLCAEKEPKTEADMREMAYGVLRGLKALHNAGLVHRDIRFPNIMYDYAQDKYVLIDLEGVGKNEEVPAVRLKSWNAGTLDDDNRYTCASDFHQLGLLLQSAEVQPKSSACGEFMDLLLSKSPDTTAENLLQHKWISQLSGSQAAAMAPR